MQYKRVVSLSSICLGLFLFVFSSLVFSQNVVSNNSVELSGLLHTIWPQENSTGQHEEVKFILIDDNGQWNELALPGLAIKGLGGIRNMAGKRINIRALPEQSNGKWQVQSMEFAAAAAGGTEGTGPVTTSMYVTTGTNKVITLACKFADIRKTAKKMSYFDGLMGTVFPGMDHYYRENSYGQLNLQGSQQLGWYTLPNNEASYVTPEGGVKLSDLLNDCVDQAWNDVNIPAFDTINLVFNGSFGCCAWGGTSAIPQDGYTKQYGVTWLPQWAWLEQTTTAHELGHALGMPHSTGPYGLVYDSNWDVMSGGGLNTDSEFGPLADHTISFHKDREVGWIPTSQKYIAAENSSATITLERLAQPTDGGTAYLMAEIPIDAVSFYTVEARRFAGYDEGLPGEAVVLHYVSQNEIGGYWAQVVDPDGNGDPNDAGAQWHVGETFQDPLNGVTVSVDADTGTGYTITISKVPGSGDLADLETTAVSGPGNAVVNTSITVSTTVTNSGTADIVSGTDVALYLSSDNQITSQDIFLGSYTAPALIAGTFDTTDTAVTIPAGTAQGIYYLGAIADSGDIVQESNEFNNALAGNSITIETTAPDLDLTTTAVSGPAMAAAGALINTSITIENIGSLDVGSLWYGVLISDTPDLSGWSAYVGRAQLLNGLSAGQSHTSNFDNQRVPVDTVPGTYYLVGYVDTDNAYFESDETNNILVAGTIVVTEPVIISTDSIETGYLQTTGKGKSQTTTFVPSTTFVAGDGVVFQVLVTDANSLPVSGVNVCINISGAESVYVCSSSAGGSVSDANGIVTAIWQTSEPNRKGQGGTTTGSYSGTVTFVSGGDANWDGVSPTPVIFTIN